MVKRLFDLLGATLALLLLSPLLLVAALAVRLDSPGPVFYRQQRVGRGGVPFSIHKFRTMCHGAGGPLLTVGDDPRITRVGAFLRRTRIDELPQLINVLRGEMSLVGPRPALPSEVARYKPHHFVRFEVLPGITGPWQVGGRNAITDFEDVVKLESAYIRGWTVWRDLVILARTVPAVVSMRGAY